MKDKNYYKEGIKDAMDVQIGYLNIQSEIERKAYREKEKIYDKIAELRIELNKYQ